MKEYFLKVEQLKNQIKNLKTGDKVYLSGTVYTARDAAHKRIFELLEKGEKLPFEIENSVIYFAGPTPTPSEFSIGSCGPTTSSRMDPYTPKLHDLGLIATIGKGDRNENVVDSIKRNNAIYFCAIGGCGALAAFNITNCEIIAFEDLGCESIKKLVIKDFPLIVGIDTYGNKIFNF